jgi:hypothetical protein
MFQDGFLSVAFCASWNLGKIVPLVWKKKFFGKDMIARI